MNILYSKTIDDTTYHFVRDLIKGDSIIAHDVYVDLTTENAYCSQTMCDDCILRSNHGSCARLDSLAEENIISEHFPDFPALYPELFP